MQITLERSGGFANTRMAWKVDSQALPAVEAQALQALAERADFFSTKLHDIKQEKMADLFLYKLTMETPQASRTLTLQAEEEKLPVALRELMKWVQEHGARPARSAPGPG